MASIRKSKKLGTYKVPKYTKERKAIIEENRRLIDKANRRLKGLKNAGYQGTWASKKLINRVDTKVLKSWDKSGKIKMNKNLSNTQLLQVQKATKQFLDSKTSRVKGIVETREATIKAIRATLSDEMRGQVSIEDAEFYYEMLGTSDFDYFADKIGASTLWALIDESIIYNDSEADWLSRLSMYITVEDLDVRERAIRLYNKYIDDSTGNREQEFAERYYERNAKKERL